MSGVLGRTPAPAGAGAPAPLPTGTSARSAAAIATNSLVLRLAAFAGLAAFATAHWGSLVVDAPTGRMLLAVLVATGGGAVLGVLDQVPLPRPAIHALAALTTLVMLGLGLMAAGLPGRLLLPEHWSELIDGLDRGLAGVEGVEWPYGGPEPWIRLTVLLGAPALLTIAAALAFWPARRAAPVLQIAGLFTLLLLYGSAVAEHEPGQPVLRGLLLLLLVGAWLWLPRLPPREAGAAAAVVVSVGLLSVPVAVALDADRPWWDYRAWDWFGGGKAITFDWNHSYGPLDWSRAGETVLNVRSDRPHYWKAETLDNFDGLRWARSGAIDDTRLGTEVAYSVPFNDTRWDYNEFNPAWDERIRFTVRSLSTNFVVGAGVILDVDGVPARPAGDGTTRLAGGSRLEEGDTYFVRAYAPNPTKAQMERAPLGYEDEVQRYTSLQLPRPGESAKEELTGPSFAEREAERALGRETIFVPLRGEPPTDWGPRSERMILNSPYAPMYEQALALTQNAATSYDAVKNVERWLQDNFTYAERVPTHDIPLMGFLEDDKRGYCQQFSGAMALMLRMSGIPARVAAGFAPGSYNKDTREYRVRDLDAHSWVEVWFTGIGWVPFDPTPARSPAASQSSALATSAAAADAGEVKGILQSPVAAEAAGAGGDLAGDDGGGWVVPALIVLLLAAPLGVAGLVLANRARRLRTLPPEAIAEVQLSELHRALVRLGWELPASTTLLGLERRLGRFAGPESEAYAGALRANRYDPRSPAGPSLGQRRALRRELTRGSALDRLKGLLAIPPGAPRS
ncbi:MAG TPA: transglutaminase domain-containing protein [Thermoleophilaceae bacterium]|jgi:transglutaminase-like putative cysteine protease